MPFVDAEIVEALTYHLRDRRVTMRLGEEVDRVDQMEDGPYQRVKINLVSGKQIVADKVLRSIGRSGATAKLNLEAVGVKTDERGRIKVSEVYQSQIDNIYAAGDVIGFPNLASTSREQVRIATCHGFGVPAKHAPELFPMASIRFRKFPSSDKMRRNSSTKTCHMRSEKCSIAKSRAARFSATPPAC